MKKACVVFVLLGSFILQAVEPWELSFGRIASRRFVLDNELTLCEMKLDTAVAEKVQHPTLTNGLRVVGGFWPAAHYAADVRSLPAEIAFADAAGNVALRFAAPTNVPPPYRLDVMLTCRHKPAVFVTQKGRTHLAYIGEIPADFDPRAKANLARLKFCVSDNVRNARASLSAGVGQADVRFVTRGRENALYLENGRVFFTFSARAYGAYQAVASFDPSRFDVRFEGVVLFDYGDGLLRNDLASHLFYDEDAREWRGWASNFSTGTDALGKRARGGLNAVWSAKCPLHGLSIMHAKSLGLDGLNEDPCGTWDAAAGKWRLLVSEFTPKGIRASMLESPNWDGPYVRLAGPVERDSTGTTVAWCDGVRYCFSGSADRACYVYSYPSLEMKGRLQFDLPPWNAKSCPNGRVWPCFGQLPEGYPLRYLLLTMDRANFPNMPKPNWTYGALCLYGAE